MGLRVRPGNESTELPVEDTLVTKTKKASQSISEAKIMPIAFFDMEGMVHAGFLPKGANAVFYMDVMKRLRVAVRWKRPEKWKNR